MIDEIKLKKKSVSQLKRMADDVFSRWVRRRDKWTCFTCKKLKPWREIQAGHFVPRRHLATRYDEENVHAQCVACNVFLKGNMVKYAIALKIKFGPDIIEKLDARSQTIKPYKKANYIDLIFKYWTQP